MVGQVVKNNLAKAIGFLVGFGITLFGLLFLATAPFNPVVWIIASVVVAILVGYVFNKMAFALYGRFSKENKEIREDISYQHSPEEQGKRHYDEGIDCFCKKEWKEALTHFEQAREHCPLAYVWLTHLCNSPYFEIEDSEKYDKYSKEMAEERTAEKLRGATTLDFSNKQLTPSSPLLMPEMLPPFVHITHLNLSNNGLGDSGVEKLCALLTTEPVFFPNLRILDLRNNQIGDLGVENLFFAIFIKHRILFSFLKIILLENNYLDLDTMLSEYQSKPSRPMYEGDFPPIHIDVSGNGFIKAPSELLNSSATSFSVISEFLETQPVEKETKEKETTWDHSIIPTKSASLAKKACFFYSRPLPLYESWIPIPIPVQNKTHPKDENWKVVFLKEEKIKNVKRVHYQFKPDEYLIYIACPSGTFDEHFVLFLEGIDANAQHFVRSYELVSPSFFTSNEGYIQILDGFPENLSKSYHGVDSSDNGAIHHFALVAVVDEQTIKAIQEDIATYGGIGKKTKEKKVPTQTSASQISLKYDFFSSTYKKIIPSRWHKTVDGWESENCLTWAVKLLKRHGVEMPESDSVLPSAVVKTALRDSLTREFSKVTVEKDLVETLKKDTTLVEIKSSEETQERTQSYLYLDQLLAREGEITEQEIKEIQPGPFNALSPESLEKLLEKASGVTTLDLSGKELTLSSSFFQIKKFPVFPQLTVLNLSHNVLDDGKKLCEFLKINVGSFPKLAVLNLDDNQMGGTAFLYLSEWIYDRLRENPKVPLELRHIYLRNNLMSLYSLLKSQQEELDAYGRYQGSIHFYLSGNSNKEEADELFDLDKEILGLKEEKAVGFTASSDAEDDHTSLSSLPLKKRICFFHSSLLPLEVKIKSYVPLFLKDRASSKIAKKHLPFHSDQGLLYVASPKKSRSTLLMGEHLIICLEGMRPSGQRFVLRYEVFGSEVGILTIRKMEGKTKELTKTGAFDLNEGEYAFAPVAIMDERTLVRMKAELDQMEKGTEAAFFEKEEAKKAKKAGKKLPVSSAPPKSSSDKRDSSAAPLDEKVKPKVLTYSLSASFFKWLSPTTHKSEKEGNCVTIMLELFERFNIKIPKGTESVRPSDVRDYFLREYEAGRLQKVEESTSPPKEVESASSKRAS